MREPQARAFLERVGWGEAARRFLAGDASARAYERVALNGARAVLMDAPAGCGDEIADFEKIARHLRGLELSAPAILASDADAGFMLIEDLGDAVFARLLEGGLAEEGTLYQAAVDALLRLQAAPAPALLADLSAEDWAASCAIAVEFYAFGARGARRDPAPLVAAVAQVLRALADGPRVLILRDYHAENLIWLPHRSGPARVGLLDFQLAQMGQPAYDLVSMLQDARRDVSAETEAAMLAYMAAARGEDVAGFAASYAALGALRALRILGIFARLAMVAGKDRYLGFVPRVWGQLQRNLAHPALATLAEVVEDMLPAPDAVALERIRRCHALCP